MNTFKVGDEVIVAGAGTGRIEEILPPFYEGDRRGRRIRVNHGATRCSECGRLKPERREWHAEMHVSKRL